MPVIAPSRLIELQSRPQNIRNVCILAHVDHGKTTLTDSLIATNGIISPKMAGKVRYLDSRPDEQTRGITMESSAISLYFAMARRRDIETTTNGACAGVTGAERVGPSSVADGAVSSDQYLINLIDSPGHIDFSSEVSTASRLSDAAIVLVDAVEGVCSQTVTSLRQIWTDKLKPLLVINKIDRLVTELKMSPAEAYSHLGRVLEGVNAVIGGFFQGKRMEEDLLWRERMEERRSQKKESGPIFDGDKDSLEEGVEQQFEERDDEELYFAPERHNVIFASAIDGWGFTVRQFAAIYEKKLAINRAVLEKVLWGDYYLDPKTKKVLGSKHLRGRALKPIFVQLVLEPLWTVYEAAVGGAKGKGDQALLEKVTRSLSISLSTHIARSREPKTILQAVFAAWLPLSTALLVSIIEYLPNPPEAQASRLSSMLDELPGARAVSSSIRDAMVNFRQGVEVPVVAYVSKMVAIPESELPAKRRQTAGASLTADEARELAQKKRAEIAKARAQESKEEGLSAPTTGLSTMQIRKDIDQEPAVEQPDDPQHLIGFARLYSGSLSVGDEVYVLPPKFNPTNPYALRPEKVRIKALYLLMGRALEALQTVPAGAIFGIEGLDGHILKNGTLCSNLEGAANLAGTSMASQPIVRVALEPVNPADLNKMAQGMRLLERSDPCAIYEQLESGEHVILTAGELHLERCLKDLRERFARCEIQAGEPIVPYRETIVKAEEMEPPKNKGLPRGTVIAVTASKQVSARLRLRPLPAKVTEFLMRNVASIRRLYSEKKAAEQHEGSKTGDVVESGDSIAEMDEMSTSARGVLSISDFREQLQAIFDQVEEDREVWKNVVGDISAFGPKRVGPNLFIDATGTNSCERFLEEGESGGQAKAGSTVRKDEQDNRDETGTATMGARDFSDTILYAFQLATHQGPLCREPMQGVAVFLESVTVHGTNTTTATTSDPTSTLTATATSASSTDSARVTGELISSVRSAIGTGFVDWSARILLAMYSCRIQATPEVLGRVYGVLSRRRGRVISESLLEGTAYFTIESTLPVAESFGFSDEMGKRTSGLAPQPVLVFAGFGLVDGADLDPAWIPSSDLELEDLGRFADRHNLAKRYVDAVRSRKGLLVRGPRGLGRDAEKQSNLKTN